MNLEPKRIILILGLVAGAYVIAVPMFWPEPRVEASFPPQISLRQDPVVTVRISAWHSNIAVSNIRFYVDHVASTAKGSKGLMYPVLLLEARPEEFRGMFSVNPVTRPWSRTISLTVPIHEAAAEELLGPGILAGKLDVNISYAIGGRRYRGYGADRSRKTMLSVPFQIEVVE